MTESPTRLLIVDDSALYRQTITNVLRDVGEVELIGIAKNGVEAIEKIETLDPDLLTLDVQMPDMDGIGVLREMNRRRLRPKAIMVSSLTSEGAQVTTDALLEGAFDFILKPSGGDSEDNRARLRDQLVEKISEFRQSMSRTRRRQRPLAERRASEAPAEPAEPVVAAETACRAVVIGCSTGGPAALKEVLPSLPASLPVPVLVVQHMPAQYTQSLAGRLDEMCELDVVEGANGQRVQAGRVYIAPGGFQMQLVRRDDRVLILTTDDPHENGCRPAADYLLRAATTVYGGQVLAVIMTGMGRDGQQGCVALKDQGGTVFGQHEYGCLVYGMPKAVIDAGLADRVLPLGRIGAGIQRHVERSLELKEREHLLMSTAQPPNGISVLVAEDSRIQAQFLSKKLTEAGYDVRVAENGAIALDAAREQRPTLIVSDIEMPTMTGYEFCAAIKSDPELRSIPFILLSTLSEPQDIIRGLHSGADNYVTKPYDPEFLIARIESLLATPVGGDEEQHPLEVTLAGEHYTVNSGRQQVLNLLVSTFEGAVEKNNELQRTNQELTLARDQLTVWNTKLESLNEQLEQVNTRMSRDLAAAARVQQSLLPTKVPDTPRVRFAWKYLPCDELAGDFLNFFKLDDNTIAAFVVDVSGHGVASSLLSVTIGRLLTPQVSSSSLLAQANGSGAPRIVPTDEVACELNRRFPMAEQNNLYFTMAYGLLNIETLEFRHVLAGHPRVVHVPRSGALATLENDGMAIGWIPELMCDEHTIQLQPGDRLYMYSDGVPEAMDHDSNQFGETRMLEVLELGKSQSLDDSVDLLMDVVQRWGDGRAALKDDVTILGLEIPEDA